MHTLLTLAAVVVALAWSRPGAAVAAPQPKEKPLPSIDGKYTLLSMSTPADRGGGGGGFPAGGPGGGGFAVRASANSVYMAGPATITKTEITLEGSGVRTPFAVSGPTSMEYTLDPTKTPMTIDVDTISLRGKKTRALGLVEVVGDRLVIAVGKEGDERPKSTEEANEVTVYYFKKAPPPPRPEFRIVAMTVGKEGDAEKELNKLAQDGYELVSTTTPAAVNDKASPTTVHFVLKRTVK